MDEIKQLDFSIMPVELVRQKIEITLDRETELDFIFTTRKLNSGFRECFLSPIDFQAFYDENGNLSKQGTYKLKLLRSLLDTIFELSGIKYTPGEAIAEPKEQKGIYEQLENFQVQFAGDRYANIIKSTVEDK